MLQRASSLDEGMLQRASDLEEGVPWNASSLEEGAQRTKGRAPMGFSGKDEGLGGALPVPG